MAPRRCITFLPLILVLFFISRHTASSCHDDVIGNYKSSIVSGVYSWYMKTIEDFMLQLESDAFDSLDLVSSTKTFDVDSYGAKGDGKTDDTEAFKKAWKQACSSKTAAVFLVAKNKKYLVAPIRFEGPCNASITIQISGTILASTQESKYKEDENHWLRVDEVENLVVEGGGVIDGNGDTWWRKSCKVNETLPCTDAPTALTIYKCTSVRMSDLKIQNAQQIHVSFDNCNNVQASNVQVSAPGDSPNTDGIHVTHTQNITISNSVIGTGDDCISIVSGSNGVKASGITCGPGHGISIGSLGSDNAEAHVSDVTVDGAQLTGTTNGVRIKTWQGGSGNASNIVFRNINMKNVSNTILIDQNYCDQDEPCDDEDDAVEIINVTYEKISGTSAKKDAITFNCSKSHPCQGIALKDINLTRVDGSAATAICNNVKLSYSGTVIPRCPNNIVQERLAFGAISSY
ncbi:hypothetical protein SSX86_026564 [Deinandra increscens subsp. villosa]|uniref:endo-polygalacturonase n=1 Tax=Deinandra increscens subsp. villosa TaxID=3103831 RepID=A0AAP0CF37_9ASTR